jgi:hypothetical protein
MTNFDSQPSSLPFKITIVKRPRFAKIEFFGAVTLSSFERAFTDLVKNNDFRANLNACYDFSGAIIELDIMDIENHANYIAEQFRERGSIYQLALVSDDTFNTALLNIFQIHLSKTSIEVEVFGSTRQAEIWLTSSL